MSTLGELVSATLDRELVELGRKIGRIYTDHGLPIDIALDRLDYSKEQKLAIINGICEWLIEHKRNSRATDKAIERQRTQNVKMVEAFIKTGETGVY